MGSYSAVYTSGQTVLMNVFVPKRTISISPIVRAFQRIVNCDLELLNPVAAYSGRQT
jgi:hypothetical protein